MAPPYTNSGQWARIRNDEERGQMTTLNTIEDFLRVVREDAEIRAAVRRELLTGELLSLPQRVSTLTERLSMH